MSCHSIIPSNDGDDVMLQIYSSKWNDRCNRVIQNINPIIFNLYNVLYWLQENKGWIFCPDQESNMYKNFVQALSLMVMEKLSQEIPVFFNFVVHFCYCLPFPYQTACRRW